MNDEGDFYRMTGSYSPIDVTPERVRLTVTEGIAAGAALASALMAANYPGDSGEDVDRLVAELAKRDYVLTRARQPGRLATTSALFDAGRD